MSIQQSKGEIDDKLSDKDIEDYLRQHPDYFERHTELLMELKIPHPNTGSAVSLIEHQVELLRQQNSKVQQQLDDLVQIARENDRHSKNMHQLMLAMVGARNLNEVFSLIDENLRKDFAADAVCIKILAEPKSAKIASSKEFAVNAAVIVCLVFRYIDDQLFAGTDGGPVYVVPVFQVRYPDMKPARNVSQVIS